MARIRGEKKRKEGKDELMNKKKKKNGKSKKLK